MIISVEGSIGAGKTTLLNKIAHELKFDRPHIIALEPVDDWMKLKVEGDSKSLFEHYYSDKSRYAFMFQMYAMKTRFEHIMKLQQENPETLIICERCHLTDCEVFAKMLAKDNLITPIEFEVYKTWYTFITGILKPQISGILYLRVDPHVCVQRIMKRNRTGEDKIDLEYLAHLHQQHESWLAQTEKDTEGIPIGIVDGNGPSLDTDSIVSFVNTCIRKKCA